VLCHLFAAYCYDMTHVLFLRYRMPGIRLSLASYNSACVHASVCLSARNYMYVCERERESVCVCVCVTWHGTTESNLHSTEVADVIALLLPPRLGLSTSIYLYKHTNTHTIHTHTNTHTHTPQVEEAFYLHLKTPPLKCPHK
jgi:hypothetical protein